MPDRFGFLRQLWSAVRRDSLPFSVDREIQAIRDEVTQMTTEELLDYATQRVRSTESRQLDVLRNEKLDEIRAALDSPNPEQREAAIRTLQLFNLNSEVSDRLGERALQPRR